MTERVYAVAWREGEATPVVGSLELTQRRLRVTGRAGTAAESSRVLRYGDIDGIALRRLDGRRVLELLVRGGPRVSIASLDRAGSLAELARELRLRSGRGEAALATTA